MQYKVALITGAGSGIGRELALALSRKGTAIAAVDYVEDGIKKLEAEMTKLARNLEFEQAAKLRDEIQRLRQLAFGALASRAG